MLAGDVTVQYVQMWDESPATIMPRLGSALPGGRNNTVIMANFGLMHLLGGGAHVDELKKHQVQDKAVLYRGMTTAAPPLLHIFSGAPALLALRKPGYSPARAAAAEWAFRGAFEKLGMTAIGNVQYTLGRVDATSDGMPASRRLRYS